MKEIQSIEEWKAVHEQSKSTPVFVIKHSSTCPISAAGYRAFEAFRTSIPKYVVIVQRSRPVSNEIERDLGIRHESPQLFLLNEGQVSWHGSHYEISEMTIQTAVDAIQ